MHEKGDRGGRTGDISDFGVRGRDSGAERTAVGYLIFDLGGGRDVLIFRETQEWFI